ncbi:MAG: cupin domain-containing protein [Pseudomonadales bacterium]|nr:cupin domain-containing protein [Pseudomonadales bacterium]MBL6805297.1 cupin domain-containing protein [Pseudomonadales bacterium]
MTSKLIRFIIALSLMFSSLVAAETINLSLESIQWGKPGGGQGFPVGVQTQLIETDDATFGISYYARFPAGSRFDPHWHSFDEFATVLQGEVTLRLNGESLKLAVGGHIRIPGRAAHSWDVPNELGAEQDVILLVRRAGPADFHFVK